MKVAQAQLNVANSLVTANQAQVKQFTAALQSAQIDLDHTNIKAPVDGVVVSRNVDVGQTVAASLAAPTLFLIAQDLTKMQVDTNVSEADVGRVRVNQPATFTVDAYPGQTFTGTVTSIRKAPINVQNVITYDAVIGVSNLGPEAVSRHDGEREDSGESAPERAEGSQRRACAITRRPRRQGPVPAAGRAQGRRTGEGCLDPGREQQAAACRGRRRAKAMARIRKSPTATLKDGDRVIVAALAKTAPRFGRQPRSLRAAAGAAEDRDSRVERHGSHHRNQGSGEGLPSSERCRCTS